MNEFPRGYRPPSIERQQAGTETRIEGSHEILQAVTEQMTDLVREHGVEALKAMLAKMQAALDEGRGFRAEELHEVIETYPERSKFQEAALSYLEQKGFVERTGNGSMIVDSDRLFTEFSLKHLDRLAGQPFKGLESYNSSRLEFLGNAFANKDTVLRRDFESDPETQPKPFFYLPETREEALDPEKIRASQFHFGLWEVPMATQGADKRAVDVSQPASITDQKFFETSLAAILYHPNYGNARRDEHGQLVVKSGDGEVGVSGEWLFQQGLKFSLDGQPGIVRTHAKDTITKHAPSVFERGLLQPEDFGRELHSNRAQEAVRISSNGVVSIGGVKHYLGRQFAGRSIRIDRISDNLAALVELDESGLGQPAGLINTFGKGDERLAFRKTNSTGFFEAGGKLTKPRAFQEQEFSVPQPGEDPDTFFERKQAIEAFQAVLHFDNALKQKTDTRLFDLAPELQSELRSHGDTVQRHEQLLLDFVEASGKDGLEIVATISDSAALLEQITKRVLDLPEAQRNVLVPSLREGTLARFQALQELETSLNKKDIPDLEYRKAKLIINDRIASLITAAEDSVRIKDSLAEPERQKALKKLAQKGTELELFAKVFGDAFKGSKETAFESIRGISIETHNADELEEHEKDQMLTMHAENWRSQKPEAYKKLRASLETALTNPSTAFYTMKKNNDLVAFMRFDQRPDLGEGVVYAASLNVKPEMRGSAIGEVFMSAAFAAEAKDHILKADFFPEFVVGTKYVNEMGWVITGVEEVSVGDGRTAQQFIIERDDHKNTRYRVRGAERIDQLKGLRSQTFDVRKGTGELTRAVAEAQTKGQVVTRYFADLQNPNLRTMVFEPAIQEQGLREVV